MDYSGSSNQDDLAVALSGIQLRRKKSEVLVDLPALRETTCFVQPSTALRRAWLDALKKLSSDQALDPSSLQDFLSIYKQVGLEKVEAVVELASDIVSSGDGPVIVLIYNTDVHKALLESFARLGLRVCSIVGSTSASHRQSIVRDFQSGCYDVLIGSDAVREGVTLTRAHHVIQAQYWWTEAAMDQGHSRAHRFGQLLDVWVHYAHCRGTIDDHIVSAVKRKTGLREGIVEAAKSIVDEKILQILGGLS
jgi:SNF2 family DNA or RNA helicase